MRPLMYLTKTAELALVRESGCAEVLIAPARFSRRGTLEWDEARALAETARAEGLEPLLEWDALMTERQFLSLTADLRALVDFPFRQVRVRDAGAAWWLLHELPAVGIQLLLEAGHHNLRSLETWVERLGPRLTRLALSPEIPVKTLGHWRGRLGVPLEVLGLGPLLLFHSPRALLSALRPGEEAEEWEAEGASEESPHKGFLLRENAHGTLMFHPKDLCLLERWDDLHSAGVDVVRMDHRDQEGVMPVLAAFLRSRSAETLQALRNAWAREWMRGYFDVNKSDVLFPKLKNPHLRHRDGRHVGEVLQGKRDGWLAVKVGGAGISRGEELVAVGPEGEERPYLAAWLKDAGFAPRERLEAGEVGFLPWLGGCPAKTVLLRG